MYFFSKSHIGYSHLKTGKPCQDYSSSYHDEERTIITCSDGHGGNIYIRSDRGSRFASSAIIKVFSGISSIRKWKDSRYKESLKLRILSEWNSLVEEDLKRNPIRKAELSSLSEEEKARLLKDKTRAYGTTLGGAMVFKNRLFIVHLGDGESLILKNGRILNPFPEDDEDTVANITYSMCGADAYSHLNLEILDFSRVSGIFLCTDGLINPYQDYDTFRSFFIRPLCHAVRGNGDYSSISLFISEMGISKGIGDDVSLSFILKDKKEQSLHDHLLCDKEFHSIQDFHDVKYKRR